MAYSEYVRDKARQLRVERNLTIDELAERLAVPRTTVYGWVRDLPIGQTAKRTLAAQRAGEVTREIHRRRRAAAYALGKAEYPALLREPTFRDFVCMYIGEGSKRSRNAVAICNSDPAVVRLGAIWICRLAANPVVYSFQHHADQDPDELRVYWGKVVEVSPAETNSSASRTAAAWRAASGARPTASSRSAPRTPTCARGSKPGWTSCAPNGPRIARTGRGSAW